MSPGWPSTYDVRLVSSTGGPRREWGDDAPELELGKPPDERPKLFGLARALRQARCALFDLVLGNVHLERGVELGLEEGEEEVEEVDAHCPPQAVVSSLVAGGCEQERGTDARR